MSQKLQWLVVFSILASITALTFLLVFFLTRDVEEENIPVIPVDVVIIEREFVQGRCAWFWCQPDEYHITFEIIETGHRRTQLVPEFYFRTVQEGDIVTFNAYNKSLVFD